MAICVIIFSTFYLLSAVAIIIKLRLIISKNGTAKIYLYDDKEYSVLKSMYAGSLRFLFIVTRIYIRRMMIMKNIELKSWRLSCLN